MARKIRNALLWGTAALLLLAAIAGSGVMVLRSLYPYPAAYRTEIQAAAEKYDLPPSLVCAVIHTESGFRPDVRSSAGAIGLMQVTAPTMEWALMRGGAETPPSAEALLDPTFNIEIGCCVLNLLTESFGEQETVLAAYNAGMGNVRGWLEDTAYSDDGKTLHTIPFKETSDYVKKVRCAQILYQILYGTDHS